MTEFQTKLDQIVPDHLVEQLAAELNVGCVFLHLDLIKSMHQAAAQEGIKLPAWIRRTLTGAVDAHRLFHPAAADTPGDSQ